MAIKKISLMYREFGQCEEHTCRECSNLKKVTAGKKVVHKCSVYGNTSSSASDWAMYHAACGMFNKTWGKRPIAELMAKPRKEAQDTEPLDGQMMLEV